MPHIGVYVEEHTLLTFRPLGVADSKEGSDLTGTRPGKGIPQFLSLVSDVDLSSRFAGWETAHLEGDFSPTMVRTALSFAASLNSNS